MSIWGHAIVIFLSPVDAYLRWSIYFILLLPARPFGLVTSWIQTPFSPAVSNPIGIYVH